MTLAERLLAGEHHGCASWTDVARRFNCNERTLRVVRKALEARGQAASLLPDEESHGTKPTVQVCAGCSDCAMGGSGTTCVPGNFPIRARFPAQETPPKQETKWPSVVAFDSNPEPLTFRNPEALPYQPPSTPLVRKLTQAECPTGSRILWVSDVHIPIHNEAALRLMVECADRSGVTHVVAGGDIFDFNCLSQHDKEAYRTVEHATLLEEVEPGRWFMDWLASKRSILILGNHEGRLNRFVDRNPAFHGSVLSNFAQLVNLPRNIEVVPQGGSVRLGNLSMRHMDAEFKNSGGGKYPAQRVLDMYPDESNIGGHCHRKAVARRTTRDEDGVKRTRCVWMMGHMSNEDDHLGYMSPSPNWQTGFGFVDVYWVDGRPRWTVTQVEVQFDSRNRPYFQFERRLYGVAA